MIRGLYTYYDPKRFYKSFWTPALIIQYIVPIVGVQNDLFKLTLSYNCLTRLKRKELP